MAKISAFRSGEARAAYCRLYDAALAASPMPQTEIDVETSLGPTHVVIAGDPAKPPLVAIHGHWFSSTSWIPLLGTLAANHRVVMIDAIGDVNKSVATAPITTAAHIVTWLDETLRALEIDKAAMVAMSMGAWRAANYAMAFPGRVDRLALVCPAGLVSGQRMKWLFRGFATSFWPTEARVESFLDTMATPVGRQRLREDPWRSIIGQCITGVVGFKPAAVAVRPTPLDLQPLSAKFPILVVLGKDETLHDGPKVAARFRQQLPAARVELVDNANHIITVDQPEVVEQLLADFLR
jgi:pimeloyl-ACP methyl ester carboxylesterase